LPWLNQTVCHVVVWAFTTAIITCTANGCSMYFNPNATPSTVRSALALLKASLFLQLFLNIAVLVFLFLVLSLGHKLDKHRNNAETTHRVGATVLLASFVLMQLIVARNVFRTVQLFESPVGPIWTEEAYYWVLEPATMVCFSIIFHVLHPAKAMSWEGVYECGRAGGCA
jgi:hypothetical protein